MQGELLINSLIATSVYPEPARRLIIHLCAALLFIVYSIMPKEKDEARK